METACHPDFDQIAARVQSKMLQRGSISLRFDFPYGSLSWGSKSADWESPHKHKSQIIFQNDQSVVIERILDADKYFVNIQWKGTAQFKQKAKHSFINCGLFEEVDISGRKNPLKLRAPVRGSPCPRRDPRAAGRSPPRRQRCRPGPPSDHRQADPLPGEPGSCPRTQRHESGCRR